MLTKYKKEISYCTYCPKLCRFACPVTNAECRETVAPTTKMVFLHLVRAGAVDLTAEEADIFHRCLGCRLCRAYCKHRIDVGEIMISARAEAVLKGAAPEHVRSFIHKYRSAGNPYGVKLREKLDALRQERRINKSAPAILYISPSNLEHYPETAERLIKMMEMCGRDFAVYGGDPLGCGSAALYAGDTETFGAMAKKVAAVLNRYETVISADPDALSVMKEKYPEAGAKISGKLLHATEWMAEQARGGRLQFDAKTSERVMYHDPCHLAKYLGVLDPPRELLDRRFYRDNILEFSWNRDKNYCCGGGSLLPVAAPDTALAVAGKRLEEYREAKPDLLVTACPSCRRMFEKADPSVKTADLIDLVFAHLKK